MSPSVIVSQVFSGGSQAGPWSRLLTLSRVPMMPGTNRMGTTTSGVVRHKALTFWFSPVSTDCATSLPSSSQAVPTSRVGSAACSGREDCFILYSFTIRSRAIRRAWSWLKAVRPCSSVTPSMTLPSSSSMR